MYVDMIPCQNDWMQDLRVAEQLHGLDGGLGKATHLTSFL
jgi:hypothetical protein